MNKIVWIVAAYYDDEPNKPWQVSVHDTQQAAHDHAAMYADNQPDDDVEVVVFKAEVIETVN